MAVPDPIDIRLKNIHNSLAYKAAMRRNAVNQAIELGSCGIKSNTVIESPKEVVLRQQKHTSFGIPIPKKSPVQAPTEVAPRVLHPDGTFYVVK